MADRTRIAKVNELIRQQLAELLRLEVELRRDVLATVTRVECSVDLRHATVSISVLPLHRTPSTLRKLRTRLNALQRQINSRLSMRPVPRLRFVPDKGEQHAAHMEQIFAANRREQPREPVQP